MKELDLIVGVWRITTKGAPYPYHMFVFHDDGIFGQYNPHEGNQETSDTPGAGLWRREIDGSYTAKFGEFRVDRQTHETTYGEVSFRLELNKKGQLKGTCEFHVYSADTKELLHGPHAATVKGSRLVLS